MHNEDEEYEEWFATVVERVTRATRAFKALDEAESIVFTEMFRIELEGK